MLASDPSEFGLKFWNLGVAIFEYVVVAELILLSFLEIGLLLEVAPLISFFFSIFVATIQPCSGLTFNHWLFLVRSK